MEQSLFFEFLVAWLLWAFIWLERDLPIRKAIWAIREPFGWIRTFALISMMWAINAWIDINFHLWYFTISIFFIITIFILTSYIYSCFRENAIWITTELSSIMAYLIWVLVVIWSIKFAIIFTILITVVLSSKEYIEKIKESIHRDEFVHTLKFWVVALVILPILPDEKYSIAWLLNEFWITSASEWTNSILSMQFFNPYWVWFFVVAISTIWYIWYILSKFLSKDSSVILSSIVWWLVSSTAVTATMSEQSKNDSSNYNIYVVWTMLANTIMLIRVVIIVLIFNIDLKNIIIFPAYLMFLWLLLPTLYFYDKSRKNPIKKGVMQVEKKLESPFRIAPALKFGLFILFVKFISAIWIVYQNVWNQEVFYYILWLISGLADVDAITQTMASQSQEGLITWFLAVSTILVAVMSNNMVKWSIAIKFWDKAFWKRVLSSFIISIVLWIIGMISISI